MEIAILSLLSWVCSALFKIIVAYAIVSAIFFCFPSLLRRPKTYKHPLLMEMLTGTKILRIAHRGGPRHTTQNTLQAFRKVRHISDILEMDVCVTKDNILVVHHDSSLKRTCGVDARISDYNYADLPPFQDKIKLDFGCSLYIESRKEKIPTLEAVFQEFEGVILNIELKTPTLDAQNEFARLIRQYKREEITIVGIRNDQNHTFRDKNPDILTFFNDVSIYKLLLGYFTGLLPFMSTRNSSVQVPVYSQEFLNWNIERTAPQQHRKVRVAMQVLRVINVICMPMLWHLRRRGIFSMGWVCNTQESIRWAQKVGFRGIMTDEPFLLDRILNPKDH